MHWAELVQGFYYMRKVWLITTFNILIVVSSFGQEIKYYHTFEKTDSNIRLTDWRVNLEDKGESYIIETVDSENRVKELRLIHNNELYNSSCYDVGIIKFEYKKDTIIQYNMIDDLTYSTGIECGEVSKVIYILDNGKITHSLSFIFFEEYLDKGYDLDEEFKLALEKGKEENKHGIQSDADYVFGFVFSSSKFNGFLPRKNDFTFEKSKWYLYPYSQTAFDSKYAVINSVFLK